MLEGIFQNILTGLIVLAIAAGAGFIAWRSLKGRWRSPRVPPPPQQRQQSSRFTILVAQLEDDADGARTQHVIESLRNEFHRSGSGPVIQILPFPKLLASGQGKAGAADAVAEKRGRKWLAKQNADLLVWGSAAARDKLLRLRFLARDGLESGGGDSAKPYTLDEVLELPENFGADLSALLTVAAMAAIQPVYDQQGALAPIIEPAVKKLAPLAANPPASLSGGIKASLWHTYATGEYQLGAETGDDDRLETAIIYYRKTLDQRPREQAPLQWAAAQGNLGNALRALGERGSGTVRLEQAIAVYREVLTEYTRARAPLQWAATQNNLGTALAILGERKSGTERLEEAADLHAQALTELTRERVPLQWAMTQNNLGNVLASLGKRERGTVRLEEAVATYAQALSELTRERVPLQWAATRSNLGAALTAIGERESGTARFEEAIAIIREALKQCTRERNPFQWAAAQANLANALSRFGKRESGTARLEEAVSIIHAALNELDRKHAPIQWALLHNNLGEALQVLGERQAAADWAKGCATLKEARAAFTVALAEFVHGDASHFEAETRRNLGLLVSAVSRIGTG